MKNGPARGKKPGAEGNDTGVRPVLSRIIMESRKLSFAPRKRGPVSIRPSRPRDPAEVFSSMDCLPENIPPHRCDAGCLSVLLPGLTRSRLILYSHVAKTVFPPDQGLLPSVTERGGFGNRFIQEEGVTGSTCWFFGNVPVSTKRFPGAVTECLETRVRCNLSLP
jgi:hypothetical protein